MPNITTVFFMEDSGKAPVLEWLLGLSRKLQDKCMAKIERLAELGHLLRRPDSDYLRDGIFELRICYSGHHYRILYFFHERKAVVLSNAFLKKQKKVPKKQIEIALKRKKKFEKNPFAHTYS